MDDYTSPLRAPSHLWRHQYNNSSQSSKAYTDTTKCFEMMFRSQPNISNNEITMSVAQTTRPNTQSFQTFYQNPSDENVAGSRFLLVPPTGGTQLSPLVSTHHNAQMLPHQKSLPNYSYQQSSRSIRSNSIISEHSGGTESPPMNIGECYLQSLIF